MYYLLNPYPDVQIYTKGSYSPHTGYGTFGAVMRFAPRSAQVECALAEMDVRAAAIDSEIHGSFRRWSPRTNVLFPHGDRLHARDLLFVGSFDLNHS